MNDSHARLLAAIAADDVAEVERIAGSGIDLNLPCEQGATALFPAILRGNAEVVRVLLDHGADPNFVASKEAWEIYGPKPLDTALASRAVVDWDTYDPIVGLLQAVGATDCDGHQVPSGEAARERALQIADPSPPPPVELVSRRGCWLIIGLVVVIAVGGMVGLGFLVREARRAAQTMASYSPLAQVAMALHNYHDTHGQFPPAYLVNESGKPIHSWRVLILPFVEEHRLYESYDFSEPWDGPNNSKLADRMPRTFRSHSEPPSTTHTNVVLITGPGTAFPGTVSTRLSDITDGTQNTILVSETADSTIPWLAPRDIEVIDDIVPLGHTGDPDRPGISAVHWRHPLVVFADRISGYRVSNQIPPEALRALTTIAGGEPISRDELIQQGYLGTRTDDLR
ncbi:MAG: DUF1559 domain-containing protein [Planctomycetaceae bacterium]|nr:MAG: DUF1559 domain-containing protein [Planctomycetaceae bacterium]